MLFGSNVPLTHWSNAAEYATFILNRSPTRANAKRASPLEVLTGKVPSLQDIVVFRSPCQVWRDPFKRSLKAHTVSGYILDKDKRTKGYKVLLRGERSIVTTRHVTNIETLDNPTTKLITDTPQCEEDTDLAAIATSRSRTAPQQHDASREEVTQATKTDHINITSKTPQILSKRVRRSTRAKKKSRRQAEDDGDDDVKAQKYLQSSNVKSPILFASSLGQETFLLAFAVLPTSTENKRPVDEPDPLTYGQARRSVNIELWKSAEQEELNSLATNKTWNIVVRPQSARPLPTKWVYN